MCESGAVECAGEGVLGQAALEGGDFKREVRGKMAQPRKGIVPVLGGPGLHGAARVVLVAVAGSKLQVR